jgi:hypothetical protein
MTRQSLGWGLGTVVTVALAVMSSPSSAQVDPSDPCGAQHAAFAQSQSYYLNAAVTGAVTGAAGGALIGGLLGGGKGAGIGAGVGALGGLLGGVSNAHQQQNTDQAALANSTYGNIAQASQQIDRASTTFGLLRNCRFTFADNIKAQVRQGVIARNAAVGILYDERRRFTEEIAMARQYGAKMAEQDQQFVSVSNDLVQKDPQAQQEIATRAVQPAAPAPPPAPPPPAPAALPAEATTESGTQYYVGASTSIRQEPDSHSATVGRVSKGDYVIAEAPDGGWQWVTLDDGTKGYVLSRHLKRLGSSAGGAKERTPPPTRTAEASRPAPAPPPAESAAPVSANRAVQIHVEATETLPEKRVAYNKSVDQAEAQSNVSFNLDQG